MGGLVEALGRTTVRENASPMTSYKPARRPRALRYFLAAGGFTVASLATQITGIAAATAVPPSASAVVQVQGSSTSTLVATKKAKRHKHKHHKRAHRKAKRAATPTKRTTKKAVAPKKAAPTRPTSSIVINPIDNLLSGLPLFGLVGSRNVFAQDVSRAPLNPNSRGMVANLSNQVTSLYNGVAAFNVWNYNIGFATASPTTPKQRVTWDNCQRKGYTPSQLYTAAGGAVFVDVPIPTTAVPAPGSDSELAVWDPVADKLWEFWKANKQADGWHACWGGRIDRWSSSPGYFPNGMGATATGLAISAGMISVREAKAGQINHAMTLAMPRLAHWSQFSYPAQRSDGGEAPGTPNAIPEGIRFRLDPSLDTTNLKLTPLGHAIARAAQKYGFIVTDKSGAVAVQAESGVRMAANGSNPWDAVLGTTRSYEVMRNFPWNRMQALPFDYGKP